ncbi:MAG TPA: CBS domain-containing protein [Thermoanaerobaculia bacterium]|nr:CBS domain-containing protein [Thermoanaerobaculia bacterium]
MKVKSIMARDVTFCGPETTLFEAAGMMRQIDSGILPVLREGELVGVITDRDIAVALGERDRRASEVRVDDAMSRGVYACRAEDRLSSALATMKMKRVRRLPVLDQTGRLCGILSMNDVILGCRATGDGGTELELEALETLRAVCEHRYPPRPAEGPDVTELARFV